MLIVADKQILCASCGALVGLCVSQHQYPIKVTPVTFLKDQYVVSNERLPRPFFCNATCKERAQV